jgi:hypothetical protein
MSLAEGRDTRPFGQQDYAAKLKNELPDELKPYILARFALTCYGGDSFSKEAAVALTEINEVNAKRQLKPPLSDELAAEVGAICQELDAPISRIDGPATAIILNWVITESTRPTTPAKPDTSSPSQPLAQLT